MGVAPLPHLLLLDEPFGGVDEHTRLGIHGDLLDIIYELQLTVVLVTHDIAEAISLADRVLLLSSRPGHVAREYKTHFGRPRDVRKLRTTAQYAELYAKVWQDLWQMTSPGTNR
jgi:ABC-type nitrate/sulfonate/bicarbonate transport system ATPase subunit